MMTRLAVWHGTDVALRNLQNAVSRHCTCPEDLTSTCAAHRMLLDQDVLNHLVFVHTNRMTYVRKEFDPTAEWFG